ncbi:Serine/threonine-protein kinase WNK1 [Galdieria sulphuraria]|uniref:Serine/threonine protein kinase n=1 Tax=Galdieria sulphuraria TaxID=130081 RepID=M2XWV3_GALSU|nr:serine/threonine protein kinase [Galdieria sulphuraria]EME28108.1 serine/threonine protein kinase [Galdieria sulphuraria]GJD12141.1 Serine/threonine-protein kinase WNK1 [Galdieria sulphuraria]|eukprot:XP_005704628.1 serine/threonine protein kinase [Galdieria sulphuraria]
MTNYDLESDPKGRFGRSNKVVQTIVWGAVYEAIEYNTNQLVCWYKVKIHQNLYKKLEKVIQPFLKAKHPSLLFIYALWESTTQQHEKNMLGIDFITQATSKITLKEYLTALRPLKLDDLLLWSFQIASALNFLHSQDDAIVHGNVRPENIFFSIDMQQVMLGDLLSSWLLREVTGPIRRQTNGSIAFEQQSFVISEELGQVWDEKDDVFAFGLCLFEMASSIESKKVNNVEIKERHYLEDLDASDSIKDHLKRLIKSCLGPKEVRPTANEIVNDSLFYYQRRDKKTMGHSNSVTTCMSPEQSVTDISPMASSKLQAHEIVGSPYHPFTDVGAPRSFAIQRDSPSGIPRCLVVQNQTKEPTKAVGDAQIEVLASPESKYNNCVRLSIQIPIEGSFKRIEFNFDPLLDSPESLAEEMVIELNLHALQFDVIKQDIEKHLQRILGTFPTTSTTNSSLDDCQVQQQSNHLESLGEAISVDTKEESTLNLVRDVSVSTDNISRQMFTESRTTVDSDKDSNPFTDIDLHLFWACIHSGNKQQADCYLQKNPALVHLKDENQRTPLHIAAAEGYMELVKLLVSYGAPLDVADRWGLTPILEAVASNHQAILHFLRNQVQPYSQVNRKIPSFYMIPSYYPIFDAHCHLTAQELVSIMYGQDAIILDTSDESTQSSILHTGTPSHASSSPALTESSDQQQFSSLRESSEQVGMDTCQKLNKRPEDEKDHALELHYAELRRIEEEYKQKREQLHRRFTEARSEVRSKLKQEPSVSTNSSLVSL